MKDITFYIVDDNQVDIDVLLNHLKKTTYKVVGTNTDPKKAIREVSKLRPDVVLLDIQMQPMLGTEVLLQLPESVRVIFCSSHNHLAIEGYANNFRDYLIKPVEFRDLYCIIQKTIANMPNKPVIGQVKDEMQVAFYGLGNKSDFKRIVYEELVYGCTNGDDASLNLYLNDGSWVVVKKRIGELMKVLPPTLFARISKNMLVALDAVMGAENGNAIVYCKGVLIELPIGPAYGADFYAWLEENRLW